LNGVLIGLQQTYKNRFFEEVNLMELNLNALSEVSALNVRINAEVPCHEQL
jgi:hypothetical protein